MNRFSTFLYEGYQSKVLLHLEHPHQLHVQHGANGFKAAHKFLMATHNKLTGGRSNVNISRKIDGGVSVIIDHDPKHGVSVSTKSGFNKEPKINRTPSDIEKNHGHAPGLVKTLKHVLKYSPLFVNPGHKVQGDLLYTSHDNPSFRGGHTSFKPNALEMSHPGKPHEMGIALHTHYVNGVAKAGVPANATRKNPNVYQHDVSFKPVPGLYKEEDRVSFLHHMHEADKANKAIGNYSHLTPEHQGHLQTYLNKTVRELSEPTNEGYKLHLQQIGLKNASKVKTEAAKEKHIGLMKALANHVDANKEKFTNTFKVHNELNSAKEHLIKGHLHESDEGLVVASPEGKVKLVPKRVSHALLTNTRFG